MDIVAADRSHPRRLDLHRAGEAISNKKPELSPRF